MQILIACEVGLVLDKAAYLEIFLALVEQPKAKLGGRQELRMGVKKKTIINKYQLAST